MKKLGVFLLSIFILLTLSCEIGLGSSVDTESPTLEIQNPPADAVIRDAFAITGNWGDDGSISSISVEMVRLDNNSKKKFTGSVQTGAINHSAGTWKISIDPEKDGLTDGNYEALVAIKDNGGHVTSMARSFTIDNTAPVLILTKPNSTFTENSTEDPVLSVYGKNLFLEGSIADLTKETWIEMKFYSDSSCSEESYLYTIETDSIAPTNVNQNNTKFAVYEEVEEDGVIKLKDNEYHKIYNRNEKSGAIPVYAKLTIYDIAESYSDNSANGTENISSIKKHVKGNHTQAFYISSDLAKDITKSKGNGGYGFAPIDIYNFFNGTLNQTDEARAISKKDQEAIKDLLASKEKATSVFSINPDNNPYFTVSGLKTLTDAKTNFSSSENGYFIKNGAMSLEISVFMGSDSFELDADSEEFYAYLIECDENGNPIKEDKEANRIKLYSKYKETGSGASKKLLYKVAGKEGHKTTSGAYVFFAPISKTVNTNTDEGSVELPLQYGHMYLIRVNGKDTEGNLIDNESSKYGFKFTSSGAAPVITITEPEKPTKRLKKGDKLLLRGTVDSEEGGITLSLLNDNQIVNQDITLTDTELATRYAFEYEMKAEEFDQEHSHDYTIMLKASGAESSASASRLISYDVAGPVVNITDVSPVCKKENDNTDYINGLVTISGIITDVDDVFDSGAYEVIQKDSEPPVLSGIIDKNKFTFTVDTTSDKLLDKTPVTIKIRAKDRAGNETIEPLNFVIDQTTDKPKIGSKASLKYNATIDELENGDFNLFTKTSTLYLDIDDDDGAVKNVEVTLAPYNTTTGVQGSIVDEYTQTFANTTVAAFRFPDVTGYFLVSVKAEDSNFTSQTASPNNYTVENFYVRLTGSGPDVTIKPEPEYLSLKSGSNTLKLEFTVSGEDEDTYSLDLINYIDGVKNVEHVFGHDTAHPKQTSPFIFEKEYSEIPAAEDRELKFTVKDKTGVGTDKSFTPKFDSASPTVDFDEEGYPAHDSDTDNASFYFKGSVGDSGTLPDNPSGIKEVKIFFKDGEVTDNQTAAYPADNAEGWITTISTPSTWSYLATWASDDLKAVFQDANGKAKEGKKSVFVKAFDKAGNDNETVVYKNFIYDISAPEVTEITGKEYTNENTLTLTIKVKDTNSIKPEVVLYKGDVKEINKQAASCIESVNQTGTGPDANGLFTYTVKINFPTIPATEETLAYIPDGTYNITVTPKDSNGRVGNVKTFRSVRDTQQPNINNIGFVEITPKDTAENPDDAESRDVYSSTNNSIKTYFTNNTVAGRSYKISGVSTDNVGIESVTLIIKNTANENAAADLTPVMEGDTGIWEFSIPQSTAFKNWKTGAEATITVTDIAGNISTATLNINFDTTAPVAKHEIDAKGKDLYFRIGNSNNDDITETSASKYDLTWNNGSTTNKIDEDVGGKYSNGTYGNDMTIQIRGNFEDTNGSGIKTIYYQVRKTETTYVDEANLKTLAESIVKDTTNTKSFAPLTTPETKRVFYNSIVTEDATTHELSYTDSVGGGTQLIQQAVAATETTPAIPAKPTAKFYKNVETNYKNSITGFSEGQNYIILVAEDNAGNLAVDVARDVPYKDENGADKTGTFINYSLNVDTVVPEISTDNEDIIFTNQEGYVELTGTVNDVSAGLRSLAFMLNNDPLEVYSGEDADLPPEDLNQITKCVVTITTTQSGSFEEKRKNTWNIKIPASKFEAAGKTYTVYAVAKDAAGTGNESKESVGAIKVDTEKPTVTISTPKANTDVNKEITISGSVSDGNGSGVNTASDKAPRLFWTTKEPAKDANGNYKELTSLTIKSLAKDGWTELALGADKKSWDTSTFEWSFTLDTETLKADGTNAVADATSVYFTVCANDNSGSGNTGYAPVHKLVVDQNSDRPVIKFTNVDLTGMASDNPIWITKQEIWASVSDDDGEVQSVEVSFDYGTKGTSATWELHYTSQDGFNYSFPSDGRQDGPQTIYFRVKDAKNKIFISSASESADINAPMLAYQSVKYGNAEGKNSTILYANVDLNEPSIPAMYYSEQNFASVTTAAALDNLFDSQNKLQVADTAKWHDISNIAGALGGTTKELYILVKAKDANGIKEIETKFDGNVLSPIVSSTNNDEQTMAILYKLNISTIGTTEVEKKKLEMKAVDNAGHNHSNSFNIEIDNVPPVVNIDSPSENAEIYGTAGVAQMNVTVRGRTSDSSNVSNVYMAVTESENVEPAESGVSSYKDITKRSALSWTAVFNGALNTSEDVYYTDLFNTYIDALYGTGTTTSESQKNLCLWIYAVDTIGNSGKTNPAKLPLTILTQGDKPIIAVTYPTRSSKVGGVITITGSTSIVTNEVDKIFIQIDPDYDKDTNSFSTNWKSSLETIMTTATTAGKTLGYEITEIKNSDNQSLGYGILAGGSKQSWNVVVNTASEFNKSDKTNRIIGVKAWAVSKTNKLSEPVTTWFELDPESPIFGNHEPMTLVQYEDNTAGTGNVTSSKLYTPGMWLAGKWWLTGSVEDESGIDYVKLGGSALPSAYLQEKTKAADGYDGYKLNIPVGIAEGQTTYGPRFELLAKENDGEKTSPLTINLSFDNTPPEFEATSIKTDATLSQSNGTCEISGTFKEPGENSSGFKRIMFYVTRTLNPSLYVTDIMKQQGSGIDNCRTDLTMDDDLYWKYVNNCEARNKTEIVVTAAALPDFVRAGGICRIKNVLYRIKTVTNGTGTDEGKKIVIIDDDQIDDGTGIKVDFALAQVIDNKIKEFGKTKYFDDTENIIENDDDDKMAESYTETSTEWFVSINSQNIKDGVIKVHFVAYDQAGNKTVKTYDASVANNAPRIAGVKFGTDINGNNEVDDSELRSGYSGMYAVNGLHHKANISENGRDANGDKISKLALPNNNTDIGTIDDTKAPVMTVKGMVKVIPEIVGGNNGLSWTYSVNGVKKSTSAIPLIDGEGGHEGDGNVRPEDTTTIKLGTLELLKNTAQDGNTVLGFTIWDHTDGATPGTDSNHAEVLLKVKIALSDTEKPTVGIKPFYWNSIPVGTENNSSIVYDNNGKALGHIDLESDLPSEYFNKDSEIQEFDLDPKASGIIYLEGFAKDNVVVEKLYLKFPGLTSFSEDFGLVAQRNSDGQLVTVPTLGENGVELVSALEDKETEENDFNIVHWKLKVNTAKINTVAATNVLVQVKAEDRGAATLNEAQTAFTYTNPKLSDAPASTDFNLSEDQTNSTNQKPSYRIDVVPYITEVDTYMSSHLKSSIKAAYSRTALGHYVVRNDDDESIKIKGFNLTGGEIHFEKQNDSSTLYKAAYNADGVKVPAQAKSGKVKIIVNGVETLNNVNNNNACGSYKKPGTQIEEGSSYNLKNTYAYNRMPNKTSNNLLSDDVVFDIWEFDSDAAMPMSGELREPSMKINPVTGQVGLAFVSGPADIAMADTTNELSYSRWQNNYATFNNISFTYDALGNAHATATGLDTNPKDKHAGRFSYFYSKWGQSGLDSTGNYTGTNALRLESISVPYIKGTTTKRTLSNNDIYQMYLNNEIACEEETFYTILANGNLIDSSANGVLTETRFYSPSLVSTVHDDTTAVYLAYYDSIQKQIRFRYNSEVAAVWNADGSSNGNDFVDNTGYFWNKTEIQTNSATNTGYQDYMEASTDNFSLIAGVDTQQGETVRNDISSRNQLVKTFVDKESYRRVKNIKADGTVELDGSNGSRMYEKVSYTITSQMLATLDESLRNRFTADSTVEAYQWNNNGYYWIIQNDGLIFIDKDKKSPHGKITHRLSTIKASDYSYNGYTIDPDYDNNPEYRVYERIDSSWTGQSQYFLPLGKTDDDNARLLEVPVYKQYTYNAYDTGLTGYKYIAIDASAGDSAAEDIVVAVWYDGTGLRYAYTDNPTNGKDNNIANNNLDENNKGWKGNKVIFSEGGEHCAIKIDPYGGVHIAAYADGSLRYAYLSSVDAGYNEATDSVLVDSFTITGERINLDVGLEKVGNTSKYVAVPYITYYNGTARKPTVARLVIPETVPENYKSVIYKVQGTGTDDGSDIFTGNWEISLVPTGSNLTSQYYDRMNIGLWKNEGKIVESTNNCFTITGQNEKLTSANNVSNNSDGNIYGNGTANPILGYAIESTSGTCLETAQMR